MFCGDQFLITMALESVMTWYTKITSFMSIAMLALSESQISLERFHGNFLRLMCMLIFVSNMVDEVKSSFLWKTHCQWRCPSGFKLPGGFESMMVLPKFHQEVITDGSR